MSTTLSLDGIATLSHWGVIRARGADAASFLHGQLTSDVAQLGADRARLAGYCSAKGRLLASFVVWAPAADELLLACSADLLVPTLKRLSMFVLRAQCKLSDASAEFLLHGLAGASAQAWLGSGALPAPWQRSEHAGASLVRLPDADGHERYLWAAAAGTPAPALPALSLDAWREGEIASAVPRVEAATVDQFVPQMLNFELVGGVDFKKGCYPGQEIVARSQYRGTIKRRSFLFESAVPASAGQEIFHSADPGQPAGLVVNAAGPRVLAEVKLATLDSGSLHLGAVDGPVLVRQPMPYDVDIDVTA
jgi:folate-binding protein YgfZ